ncbi:dihydrofolate reductase family protein [Spirillospora sp. NPDC029432]|uniref:dihydrofolate reductase family protein n=1 Tax=Spirillospora sp. NPDC029432 TaxID=3154599 RepID=UPI0034570931
MGRLIYSMNTSIDGYIEDRRGSIDFSAPDEEVHRLANEHTRDTAAFLFGRRLYEMMEGPWREIAAQPDASDVEAEFARLYLDTPRYVFSDTLREVPDGVTLVRRKDAVAEVKRLKEEIDGALDLGGPELAASMADLIDEFRLFAMPVLVGGGKPYLPVGEGLRLVLAEHRVFPSGTVYRRYVRQERTGS